MPAASYTLLDFGLAKIFERDPEVINLSPRRVSRKYHLRSQSHA